MTSKGLSLALVLLGGLCVVKANTQTPPVKVQLRSSWPSPPLLLEVIESSALESPGSFFPLLDALTNPDNLPKPLPTTPEALHAFALSTASRYLSDEPGAEASMRRNLALHASSPMIEAFYQYYIENGLEETRRAGEGDVKKERGCGSWVDWYGEVVCDVDSLVRLAGHDTVDSVEHQRSTLPSRPNLLPFDHINPSPSRTLTPPPHTAILYANISSPNFRELHSYLLELSSHPNPRVEYVLRYVGGKGEGEGRKGYLSGYGVFLDLKKMDYLALDDRNNHGDTNTAQSEESKETETETEYVDHILPLLQKYPIDESAPEASVPLSEEELHDIGYSAVKLISTSPTPLQTLLELSQNLPKYATALARRVTFEEKLEEEVLMNHAKAQPGINAVWLNGAGVDEKFMNPYSLLRILRKERILINSLTSLGLKSDQAIDLLTHPAVAAAQSDKGVTDGVFDASDRNEGGGVIIYWNDISKDKKYSGWNPSINLLLRPTYPGQFPQVRQNIFNVILALDLSKLSSLNAIAGAVSNIVSRGYPFSMGMVPLVWNEDGAKMARLFYHLIPNYGRTKTMNLLRSLSTSAIERLTVDWNLAREQFDAIRKEDEPLTFDEIINGKEGDLDKTRAYSERLALTLPESSHGHGFVNGKHFEMDDLFWRNMQVEAGQQVQYLAEAMYSGELAEDIAEGISTYFYDLPTTSLRRNQHIYPKTGPGGLKFFNAPDFLPEAFVYPPTDAGNVADIAEASRVSFTILVVADLESETGLALVKEALDSVREDSMARFAFVHNPSTERSARQPKMSLLISHLSKKGLLSNISAKKLLRALGLDSVVVDGGSSQTVLSPEHTLRQITGGISLADMDLQAHEEYEQSSRLLVRDANLQYGEQAIIINGRVIGPIGPGEFVAADFEALQLYELRKRTGPVVEALINIYPEVNEYERVKFVHIVSMASGIVAASQVPDPSETGLFDAPQRPRLRNYRLMDGNYTAFSFGNESTALYQLAVLVDPLSEAAQKWTPLIEWLLSSPDVYVDLRINPSHYTELPLKRFYRYNVLSELTFDNEGSEVPSQAVFEGLPVEPIYTLGMDVPPAWLVRPREAMYDLDNIQLGSLSAEDRIQGLKAVFDLDFLVVEGHARNPSSNAAPRGVQVQLTNGNNTSVDDTQVVATLGYLQFKAKPGVFKFEIREGRGRDLFDLESVGNEGWDSPTVGKAGSEITLTSFEGLTLYPRLTRKPGTEGQDVLVDVDEIHHQPNLMEDIVSRVTSFFQPKKDTDIVVSGSAQADINIFTVASGLLYERFVSIMILSVLRNTDKSVKFWFIENFLSPSFLEFIPHLAEAYGFQYELVTYKWPSWLRAQKEKQRIIWAYKILFLDVLFPMDLKKVIFVDADQIVRADLKELVDLDLHGAPYGYTPMGDDNTDMEGFRFWKTGYWKDFLRGLPYHISALYVIDLVKFRQMAAGDILRQQYQGLSADPNSLANLDQDLPNNLQREVPIFSLGEDWLWCETWCSKDRLHRAKTIDLCQNPLTKEPKLARARAIPEWEEYDSEISRFARKLADDGLIRSNAAAVDVNVLASAGKAPVEVSKGGTEQAAQEADAPRTPDSPGRDEL